MAAASGVVTATAPPTYTERVGETDGDWSTSATSASNETNTTLVVRLSSPNPTGADSAAEAQETLVSHAAATQTSVHDYAEQHDGVAVVNSLWLTNAMLVEVDEPSDPTVVTADLTELPAVESVHPNYVYTVELETVTPMGRPSGVRTASGVNVTPGLAAIDAPTAWRESSTQGAGVRVAVLDTGVDATHPDISLHTTDASDPTYPGGWAEFNSIGVELEESTPHDPNGHGTHVSGTVAGSDESGTAIGVAPESTLLVGKVLNDDGSGTFFQIIAGMQWAVESDADVMSMSIGAIGHHPEFIRPVKSAESAGVVVVAAGGNFGPDQSISPGNVFESVSVGAVDDDGTVASFSSSERIETERVWDETAPSTWPETYTVPRVSAPGVDVQSSLPAGEYGEASGTSMATPHVSGTVALMLSAAERPLTPAEVRVILAETATTAEQNQTRAGDGIVNARAATARAASQPDANEPNDEPETATLVEGTPVQGIVSSSTDTDWFRVEANGSPVTVDFERVGGTGTLEASLVATGSAAWSLKHPTVAVESNESVSGTVTFPTGTTFVHVRSGTDGGTGGYELAVRPLDSETNRDEPNDAANEATPLTPGTPVESQIEPSRDVDFYRLDVGASDSVVADMAFSHDRGDLDLVLYDADGVPLDQSVSTSDSERVEYVSDTRQSLYVSVVGFEDSTGPYTLDVTVTSAESRTSDD
ncbi:S8 family serine peptidase [Halogranum rubrum]|nr:S8 family serine peptidase [Halogranum rubrum]